MPTQDEVNQANRTLKLAALERMAEEAADLDDALPAEKRMPSDERTKVNALRRAKEAKS